MFLRRFLKTEADRLDDETIARNPYLEGIRDGPTRVGGYHFSERENQALVGLMERLELTVSTVDLLSAFQRVLTPTESHYLAALLNFILGLQSAPQPASPILPAEQGEPGVLKQPLNILFVTGEFPNPVHGGGGRVADFIREMSRDHNIYLCSAYHHNLDADALSALKPYCRAVKAIQDHQAFRRSKDRIRAFIASVPIDIVHYEWPRSLVNYDPAWGQHHIFTFMESVSLRLRLDLDKYAALSPAWLKLLTGLIVALKVEVIDTAMMDARIVTTRKDGEFYSRFNPYASYPVVNHGVDFEQFSLPDVPPDERSIVFVGNFGHYPNLDAVEFFFGQVFDRIRSLEPEVKVYLVGANPPQAVQTHHDGRRVFVTGTVDDIRPYIQRAAVCIAPLVSGAGLRSKVIQYAALKRPCVATQIAAADLQFEPGREIFIADDPEHFAQRVVDLLHNPTLARQIAVAAYQRANNLYNNRQCVNRLYALYADLEANRR